MTFLGMIVTRFLALVLLVFAIPVVIVWILTRGWGGPGVKDA